MTKPTTINWGDPDCCVNDKIVFADIIEFKKRKPEFTLHHGNEAFMFYRWEGGYKNTLIHHTAADEPLGNYYGYDRM